MLLDYLQQLRIGQFLQERKVTLSNIDLHVSVSPIRTLT